MSSNRLSLAAQLAELNQPAPVDLDPEDAAVVGAHAEDDEQPSNAGREHYFEVGPSALRKLQDSVADPKYDGIRVSRNELGNSDHADAESSDEVPDVEDGPVTSEDEDDGHEDAIDGDSEQLPGLGGNRQAIEAKTTLKSGSAPHPQPENDLSSALKRTREEERKKGKAVARQLAMYDSLLDARIRLQKCVSSMNRMPDATQIPNYLLDQETRAAADAMLSEALLFTDDLFDLQAKLLSSNESIDSPARKRRKTSDEGVSAERDWEEELRLLSKQSAEMDSTFHPHLLATLKKWSNKVLAIAPNALLPSNRTKFTKSDSNQVKSAVQLVDDALLDRTSLVARTRVCRSTSVRVGAGTKAQLSATGTDAPALETDADADADIFDDTDFYQTLLRDVIDARSGGAGLDGLTADWRLAQKQRKKAKAASVDTRASKGRKLRFEVHEKLRNFMAPAPPPALVSTTSGGGAVWHEAQIDELFAGLLGRAFGGDADADGDDAAEPGSRPMDVDIEQAVKGGFRVFG